jgi:hypothetical protein
MDCSEIGWEVAGGAVSMGRGQYAIVGGVRVLWLEGAVCYSGRGQCPVAGGGSML